MSTYLLVHGVCFGGWAWDDVVPLLEKAGHRALVVDQLPSAGTDPAALGDLSADVAYVRRMLADLDESVILVGHSYGGMVVTELADLPGVRHSVYVAAFWPPRGRSAFDLAGDGPLPAWLVPRDDGTFAVSEDLEVVRDALCADVDRERTAEFMTRLVLQSAAALSSASTAPVRGHPTTYVVCERDNVIPVPAQEAMSTDADHIVRLPSSHLVQLSMPDRLAEELARI